MAEDVLGVFPASEIWGLNRKRPCTLLVSERRLLVAERDPSRRSPNKEQVATQGIEAFEDASRFALPLEEVRWVQVHPSLLGSALKVQTRGGSYRFRLGRANSLKLERLLRSVLGRRVRRPGED
ncbi:MAG: hypothetical protein ACE5LS_02505 [Thermoplasmata archaeon]